MADMVKEALSEPAQTMTEACVANMVSDLVNAKSNLINIAGVQGVGGDATIDIISNGLVGSAGGTINMLTLPTLYQQGQ